MYDSQKSSSSNIGNTTDISLKVFPKKSYKFRLTISIQIKKVGHFGAISNMQVFPLGS